MTSGVQLAMKRANTSNTAPSILTVCMRVNLSLYVYINTRSMCGPLSLYIIRARVIYIVSSAEKFIWLYIQ